MGERKERSRCGDSILKRSGSRGRRGEREGRERKRADGDRRREGGEGLKEKIRRSETARLGH